MLHFIFYHYALENHLDKFQDMDTKQGLFWDMGEIFNAIILNLPEFKELHQHDNIHIYPQHKKHLPKLKELWFKTEDIDNWLINALDYLNSNLKY